MEDEFQQRKKGFTELVRYRLSVHYRINLKYDEIFSIDCLNFFDKFYRMSLPALVEHRHCFFAGCNHFSSEAAVVFSCRLLRVVFIMDHPCFCYQQQQQSYTGASNVVGYVKQR